MPGEENLDIVESLRASSIELELIRHEQGAAFMAATHGRLTGPPGVCIATLGPGALNFSYRRGLRRSRRHADDPDHRPEGDQDRPPGRFQIVDVIAPMTPFTKMTRQIVSAATIPSIVREAFRIARRSDPARFTWSFRRTWLARRSIPCRRAASPGPNPGCPPGGVGPRGLDDPGC